MSEATIKITLRADGGFDVDARGVKGSEKQILDLLRSLAREVGGELEVERHVGGAHDHVHVHKHEHN